MISFGGAFSDVGVVIASPGPPEATSELEPATVVAKEALGPDNAAVKPKTGVVEVDVGGGLPKPENPAKRDVDGASVDVFKADVGALVAGVEETLNESPPVGAPAEKEVVPKEGLPKVNGLGFSSDFAREEESDLKRLLLVAKEDVVVGNAGCFLSSDGLLPKNEGVAAFSSDGLENNGKGREGTGASESLEGAPNIDVFDSGCLVSADFPPKMELLLPEEKVGVKPLPGVRVGGVVEAIGLFSVEDEILGPLQLKPPLGCAFVVVMGAAADKQRAVVEALLPSNFF